MADITVTPVELVSGTASASLLDAGGESIVAAATNDWSIDILGVDGDRLLLKFLGVDTSVITIEAGDRPPSQRADLTATAIDIANTEVKYLVIDTGQHLQDDGTIRISVDTGNTTTCVAFIMPKYY